jgi:transcriptional regulator with XRE-family HTH domain
MVSYVEREMRNPTLETLLRISCAMKVNFVKILREAIAATPKPPNRSRR